MPVDASWRDVPVGAYIRDASGIVWRVDGVDIDGTFHLFNPYLPEGQQRVSGRPPLSAQVTIIRYPEVTADSLASEAVALLTLRVMLGARVTKCAWCAGDPNGGCTCDEHCGEEHCVNFVRPLESINA